jgi:PAS domain S-box-containing protein
VDLNNEPSTLVVLLSRDPELAEALPPRLSHLEGNLEVHVVRSREALLEHLATVRPDVMLLDADQPIDTLESLAGDDLLSQAPLVILDGHGRDLSAMHGEVVGRGPEHAVAVAQALVRASRGSLRFEETLQHYRDILDASSDGIFVLTGEVFGYVNPSFARSLEVVPEVLTRRRGLIEFVVEADKERVREELSRVDAAGGRRELIEMSLTDGRGRVARFEVACRSSIVEGGRAIVGVARDVTAAHELQTEIERARKRAAQVERLRALGELAAGVAHDFNNTLSTIMGRLEVARNKLARGERVEEDLDVIEAAGKNAAAVVERVREFSRPTGTDTWQDVDLAAVVRDSAELVRTRVPRGVSLVVESDPTPVIQGNGAELREVLLNLLRNALDALEPGGTVAVRSFEEDGNAVVVVEDDGRGMSESVQQRIFEPFFTTKGDKGTGLGLSVSHWILRRHDAQIKLQSEPGKGTTFRLVFAPFAPPKLRERLPTSPGGLSILVVDDDQTVAEMMRDLLAEHGHEVTVVNHPSEAAQALGKSPADLLITDLDLPGMSGWQLARKVRELQPEILVGVVTGWHLGATEEELRARGVDFVLAKPFNVDALRRAVEKARSKS